MPFLYFIMFFSLDLPLPNVLLVLLLFRLYLPFSDCITRRTPVQRGCLPFLLRRCPQAELSLPAQLAGGPELAGGGAERENQEREWALGGASPDAFCPFGSQFPSPQCSLWARPGLTCPLDHYIIHFILSWATAPAGGAAEGGNR